MIKGIPTNERGVQVKQKKKNSRGSGKRDDVVAERAHPCDTKLGERDFLTVRYGRQAVHELEVMSEVLCNQRVRQQRNAWLAHGEMASALTSSWKRLNPRLKSPSSRS